MTFRKGHFWNFAAHLCICHSSKISKILYSQLSIRCCIHNEGWLLRISSTLCLGSRLWQSAFCPSPDVILQRVSLSTPLTRLLSTLPSTLSHLSFHLSSHPSSHPSFHHPTPFFPFLPFFLPPFLLPVLPPFLQVWYL